MKVEKIFIPVSVDERYPPVVKKYFTIWNMPKNQELDVTPWGGTEVSRNNWKGNIHEWLEERQGVIVFTPEELKTVIADFGMRLSVRYKWVADKNHTMYFTGIANNNEQSIEEISDDFLKEKRLL